MALEHRNIRLTINKIMMFCLKTNFRTVLNGSRSHYTLNKFQNKEISAFDWYLYFMRYLLSKQIWCVFFDSFTINSVSYVKHKQYTTLIVKLYDWSARFLRRIELSMHAYAIPEPVDFTELLTELNVTLSRKSTPNPF